ncbi:DUF3616 domain-containing protein [bacterium]|nr:DUF3616 domain-containing protein [bacterium]
MKTLTVLLLSSMACPVFAEEIELLAKVTFKGDVHASKNVSAVAVMGDGEFLVIGSDEGKKIQVLRRTGEDEYKVDRSIELAEHKHGKEIDIEGVAFSEQRLYVIGSHSRTRSKIEPTDETQEGNHKLLEENKRRPLRENLFELKLNDQAEVTEISDKSLRDRIKNDEVLSPFLKLPSKENGIDIEAIAAVGDELYVGFRGPVLREGYVPVLVFDFDKPEKAETRYVNLGGRGIRDMVYVDDGFLIVGGPMGNQPISYQVYWWNGEDCIQGSDVPNAEFPKPLGEIPLPDKDAKAEGLTLLDETGTHYEVLIVFDGVKDGGPTRFKVKKK